MDNAFKFNPRRRMTCPPNRVTTLSVRNHRGMLGRGTRSRRPVQVLALVAALLATNFLVPTQAVAATVVFLDRTDPQFTVAEGVPNALDNNLFGSATFGTIGVGTAHFGQQRVVTELSYIGALAGGSWNDFSFRLGSVNDPLAYLTQDHATSFVGAYSNVSDEILRLSPDNIQFHAVLNGLDTFKLTFSNLNFQLDAFEEWTPIIAPFYDNGGIGGPGSLHMLADSTVFPTDDYIHHRLVSGSTQSISDWNETTKVGVNTALAFSASGHVVAVPEPGSLSLLGMVGASLLFRYRHRRRVRTQPIEEIIPS